MSQVSKEIVILLHGIGHTFLNMIVLEGVLNHQGYKTYNLTYPSRKYDIRALSSWLANKLAEKKAWENFEYVHFVGHSMGGLVIGQYLEEFIEKIPQEKMGRVVMLGTPHGGSEVADFLHRNSIYKWVFGPAGQELTTKVRANQKIKVWYDLGVLAGTKNWLYPFGKLCIKDSHDGCVSVHSTKIDGMRDHVVLPVLHGFMGWSSKVHKQTISFLENGKFNHS